MCPAFSAADSREWSRNLGTCELLKVVWAATPNTGRIKEKIMHGIPPLFLCFLLFIGGCTMSARLYSPDGEVIKANFSYSGTGKGDVWGEFPRGEKFKGEYFTIFNTGMTASMLSTPWGPLTGISVSQDGPKVSHITAVGDRGTQMQCVSFPRGAHGVGACRDSKGVEYRLHY